MARVNATVAPSPRPASSDKPRELTKEDAERILRDAQRTQEDWDYDRREGPTPPLDVIVQERVPSLNVSPEDADRLLNAARRTQAHRDEQIRQHRHKEFCKTVGQRFARATLDNYEVGSSEQQKAVNAIRSYAASMT